MLRFLSKRILIAIPTLLFISLILFSILALTPGDPLGEFAMNPSITAEIRENLRKSLGLDQPIHIRYIKWLLSMMKGDMGWSFTSRVPVIDLILQRLPATLLVVGASYVIGTLFAIPIGVISAVKHHTFTDQSITFASFLGFSMPTFFTGLLFIIIFSVHLRWLPLVYDSLLTVTDWNSFIAKLKQIIMPVTVLALWQMAVLTRFVRSSMLENIYQDYVRTAKSKGLKNFVVVNRHVLRNALIPVVTLVAIGIPTVFAGALVTENIFRVPGIGSLLITSIQSNDTPVVMGITFIFAILVVVFNLIADILYVVLDPRVTYEGITD
jgi:peptide/nickel transport system permease protein